MASSESANDCTLVELIVAMSPSGLIAAEGIEPWVLASDIYTIQKIIDSEPVIVSRRVFEEKEELFAFSTCFVIAQESFDENGNKRFYTDIEDAIFDAQKQATDKVYVLGGRWVFNQAMEFATSIRATIVNEPMIDQNNASYCDYLFSFDPNQWKIVKTQSYSLDIDTSAYTVVHYQRVSNVVHFPKQRKTKRANVIYLDDYRSR